MKRLRMAAPDLCQRLGLHSQSPSQEETDDSEHAGSLLGGETVPAASSVIGSGELESRAEAVPAASSVRGSGELESRAEAVPAASSVSESGELESGMELENGVRYLTRVSTLLTFINCLVACLTASRTRWREWRVF